LHSSKKNYSSDGFDPYGPVLSENIRYPLKLSIYNPQKEKLKNSSTSFVLKKKLFILIKYK